MIVIVKYCFKKSTYVCFALCPLVHYSKYGLPCNRADIHSYCVTWLDIVFPKVQTFVAVSKILQLIPLSYSLRHVYMVTWNVTKAIITRLEMSINSRTQMLLLYHLAYVTLIPQRVMRGFQEITDWKIGHILIKALKWIDTQNNKKLMRSWSIQGITLMLNF